MAGTPRTFGPFELLDEIARGAAGVVYRARCAEGGEPLALKMLREDNDPSGSVFARFRREAQIAARLRHPNIVPVLDAGETHGRFYFTMPLIEGRSLADLLAGPAPDPLRIAGMMVQVAWALDYAHRQGVVHRDLKPSNILVPPDGDPMITDFGIARDQRRATRLTEAGELLGTPAYMTPEQISGRAREADGRTDIYAVGVILYQALAGRPPFDGATFLDLAGQVLHAEPIPPSQIRPPGHPDLERVSLKCLRKDPALRYATAAELAADLERCLAPANPVRRPWVTVALSCLAILLGLGGALLGGARAAGPAPEGMIRAGGAWIDRAEVTMADYARFVQATGHRAPPNWRHRRPPRGQERRPVAMVSAEDAEAYARWAGKRLPTAAEWKMAARGVGALAPTDIACAETALESGPVDALAGADRSSDGALHLAGNVAEWTATEGTAGPKLRVVCGGHWQAASRLCLSAPAEERPADVRESWIGFRCALDPPDQP